VTGSRLLAHLRGNAVAYVALFVALGGTGYAAINLPAGSVGAKQIKNYSITPNKLDPSKLAGSVRAWALVSASGRVLAGEGRPRVIVGTGTDSTGRYFVTWKVASLARCAPIAGITNGVDGSATPGFAIAQVDGAARVFVAVYNALSQPAQSSFYVATLC
jgi:hypothetical protein